ncbi:MFS transporter [Hydrogenophaga electricum]|uniref:MFS transporter n=1 Tax=Hydrogenophaga electricum TaxID=1230953 RepID=A0ABQ6C6N7_9BURK|nr:MFS transporter [Hydrogenophaga electricum]GLS16016.1 MFS transporter [Hydrogenophaga electricum]
MNDLTATAPARATAREWWGLAVIALPCLVYAMDLTVLNLAVPALSRALAPSASQLLWIIDIYGFLVAGCLITMGTLGDRIGRRRLLLAGAAFFAVASVLAAFARTPAELIALRALLGMAGATLAPSTLSLIRNMFHDETQRQFAIGVWITAFSVGSAIGPLVGGWLLEHFWWGSVFLPAVPVMVLLLVLGPRLLPEYRDQNAGRIDLPSVLLSLAAVLGLIYAVKAMAEHGPSLPRLALLLAGLGVGAVFLRRQRQIPYPLLELRLFAIPAFRTAIVAYALSCLAMFGIYIFIAQFLQMVLMLSPLQAGWATVPWALGFVVGSLVLAPRLASRYGPGPVMVGGLAAASAGMLAMVAADGPAALWVLVGGMIVISLGMAPVFAIGTEQIITSAPPERAGAASSIAETASEFSGALGIALFGSAGTLIYRHQLAQSGLGGLPPEALATLGGALQAAEHLPAETARALVPAAQAAFTDALQFTALAGAALVLLASLLAARMQRRPTPAN